MIFETVSVGPMQVNCYVLASAKERPAIIIDPGDTERKIWRILEKHKLIPGIVINTHGHYDHIGCDDKFGVPVYVHSLDEKLLKDPKLNLSGFFSTPYIVNSHIKTVEEGAVIESDGLRLKVLHIPGHTPGGIALVLLDADKRIVFTGDSLFYQGIGRSDLVEGNEALLINSIKEKLLTLPGDTMVCPGHGAMSKIIDEQRHNPFLA